MSLDRIKVVAGSIVDLDVGAIVNAANKSLLGGGGVDGVIHRAAGSNLLDDCRALGGCDVGDAKITPGHRLKAGYVIHTVGPIWRGGNNNEDALLAKCHQNSLSLARKHQIESIAFPAISTGAYSFPLDRAAKIAIESVGNFLATDDSTLQIIFCMIESKSFKAFSAALATATTQSTHPQRSTQ